MKNHLTVLISYTLFFLAACSAPNSPVEQSQPVAVEEPKAPEPKPEAKPKPEVKSARKAEVFEISPDAIEMQLSEATGIASASGTLEPGTTIDFLLPVTAAADMDLTLTCDNQQATFMVYTLDGKELMPMVSTMWFGASPVDGELLIKLSMPASGTASDFTLAAQPL